MGGFVLIARRFMDGFRMASGCCRRGNERWLLILLRIVRLIPLGTLHRRGVLKLHRLRRPLLRNRRGRHDRGRLQPLPGDVAGIGAQVMSGRAASRRRRLPGSAEEAGGPVFRLSPATEPMTGRVTNSI